MTSPSKPLSETRQTLSESNCTEPRSLAQSHPTLWEKGQKISSLPEYGPGWISIHEYAIQSTTIDITEHQAAMRDLTDKVNRGSLDYARGHEEGLKHGEQSTLRRVKEAIAMLEANPYGAKHNVVAIHSLRNVLGLDREEETR